jgi:hypothetical protein
LRDPQLVEVARLLLSHPDGSDEDRLIGFRAIAAEAPTGLVGQTWGELPARCQQDPRFLTILAKRSIAERRLDELKPVLQALPESARTLAIERCEIEILIARGKLADAVQAQQRISRMMASGGAGLAEALDLLEKIPVLNLRANALIPARRVLESATAGDPARKSMMLARLDYATDFSRRTAILDAAVERWADRAPIAVARFLLDVGLFQRLLANWPLDQVGEIPGLLPLLLKAALRSGSWAHLGALIDAHGQQLPKFVESAYRAVLAAKKGDAEMQQRAWNEALLEANQSNPTPAFLKLNRLAKEADMPGEAEKAMLAAIRTGRGPLPLFADQRPLLESLARQGRDRTVLEVCAIYLLFEYGNPVLLTQFAYLACLSELAAPKLIIEAMQALAKDYPAELHLQLVIATALLVDGQATQAWKILEPLELDSTKLPVGFRAMILAARVQNGFLAANDPQITDFPWQILQPAERSQFGKWIRTPVSEFRDLDVEE